MNNQEQNNNKPKINTTQILLIVVLILSLFNGCQSCSNRTAIKQNKQSLEAQIETLQKSNTSSFNLLSKMHSTNANHMVEVVEQNTEAQVIIEKEIDRDATMKPTEIKKMFKEHRNYAKSNK
jgi:cell division protein FtsB